MTRSQRFSEDWVKVPKEALDTYIEAAEAAARGPHCAQGELHDLEDALRTAEPPAEARAEEGDRIEVRYTSPGRGAEPPMNDTVRGEIRDVLKNGFIFTDNGVEFKTVYMGYGGWKLERKYDDSWGSMEFQSGESKVHFPDL